MTNPNSLDELFQQPLNLPGNDELTARVMREVAAVERRRKVLLLGSGVVGTGVALGIVLGANVLPAISSGALPTFASCFGRLAAVLGQFMGFEPLPEGASLWMLAAASLVAMGLAAARFRHEA